MINEFLENEKNLEDEISNLEQMLHELHVLEKGGSVSKEFFKFFGFKTYEEKHFNVVKDVYLKRYLDLRFRRGSNNLEEVLYGREIESFLERGNNIVAYPMGSGKKEFVIEIVDTLFSLSDWLFLSPSESIFDSLCRSVSIDTLTYKELNEKLLKDKNFLKKYKGIICDEIKFLFEGDQVEKYSLMTSKLMQKVDKRNYICYLTSTADKTFVVNLAQRFSYINVCEYRSLTALKRFSPKSNTFVDSIDEIINFIKSNSSYYFENMFAFVVYCDNKEEQEVLLEVAKEENLEPLLIPKNNLTPELKKIKHDMIYSGIPEESMFIIVESVEEDWNFKESYIKSAIVSTRNESEEILFLSQFNDNNIDVLRKNIPGCIYIY